LCCITLQGPVQKTGNSTSNWHCFLHILYTRKIALLFVHVRASNWLLQNLDIHVDTCQFRFQASFRHFRTRLQCLPSYVRSSEDCSARSCFETGHSTFKLHWLVYTSYIRKYTRALWQWEIWMWISSTQKSDQVIWLAKLILKQRITIQQ
jgi:hypothetical protein